MAAGQAVHSEQRQRRERVRDLQIALRAEIRSELANLTAHDLEASYTEVMARIEADPDYVVLLPQAARHFVFEAIVSEIHILPEEVIDPVVLYMRQYAVLSNLADDMRSTAFRTVSLQRRMETLQDFIALRLHLRALAQKAASAIDRSLRQ